MLKLSKDGLDITLPNGLIVNIDMTKFTKQGNDNVCDNPTVTVLKGANREVSEKYGYSREMTVTELVEILAIETEGERRNGGSQNVKYSNARISDAFNSVDGEEVIPFEDENLNGPANDVSYGNIPNERFETPDGMHKKESFDIDLVNAGDLIDDFGLVLTGTVNDSTYIQLMDTITTLDGLLEEHFQTKPVVNYPRAMVSIKFTSDTAEGYIVANKEVASYILQKNYMHIRQTLMGEMGFHSATEWTHRQEDYPRSLEISHSEEQPISIGAYEITEDYGVLNTAEKIVRETLVRYYFNEMEETEAKKLSDTELYVTGKSGNDIFEIVLKGEKARKAYQECSNMIQEIMKTNGVKINFTQGKSSMSKGKKGSRKTTIIAETEHFSIEAFGEVTPNFGNNCKAMVERLNQTLLQSNINGVSEGDREGLQFISHGTVFLIKPLTDKAYYFLENVASQLADAFMKLGATDFEVVPLDIKAKANKR